MYSTTLEAASSARTRVEPTFDPGAVPAMKDAADRDLSVGGPGLAAHALKVGLVDEVRTFVYPVIVGGGNRFLPWTAFARLQLPGRADLRRRRGLPAVPGSRALIHGR